MLIDFKSLSIQNFKNHSNLQILFGDITSVAGRNGVGKSTISEAITWVLYGTDPFGTKIEPKPISDVDAETKVELLIEVDGKDILICRNQKKTAKYFINEVPKKAKEFESWIEGLVNKQTLLSLFNPAYFSTQHWQAQREQLLSYVGEPLKKEVFAALPKLQVELLEGTLKKHSLEDLQKVHAERKKTHEKSYERASERVITLQEQLEKQKAEQQEIDTEAIRQKILDLQAERSKIDEQNQIAKQNQQSYLQMQYKITGIKQEIEKQKSLVLSIKNEQVQQSCHTCGQALQGEALDKVKKNRIDRFEEAKQLGKSMVAKRDDLEGQFKQMSPVDVNLTETSELDNQIFSLNALLQKARSLELLQQEIDEAAATKEQIRKEKNESLSILDAIKEFRTKRSELMVQKIQSLFTKIDVQLYEILKNGEERATFEILMDGKPYSRLSTAEKIKAGLEVIEVLSKQGELIVPTFVDNAESILHFEKPSGQLIMAQVQDTDFTVQAKIIENKEEVING
ncbi:AAA family ATPase [Bacillus cytotoxicus]|uniref:AAA family ATPase n=1 Tax=Bacillus cytotoxicus TaxID=580165 RepID=A0ACC6A854_9BACI|nr:AAA family ATPase [Bacillus cytotoxicus]